MRWSPGEAVIERQLEERHLEKVTGVKADGAPWLARARRILNTARGDSRGGSGKRVRARL